MIKPSAGWQGAPSLTRRSALIAGVALVAAAHGRICTATAAETETHGLSAFGDLKYPADFTHFDYVDPHAPKGGAFSQIGPNRQYNQSFLTFNSLNSYVLRGDGAQGMDLTFATLMARAVALKHVAIQRVEGEKRLIVLAIGPDL